MRTRKNNRSRTSAALSVRCPFMMLRDIGCLIEFLETSSDFAFELACVERISHLGYQCRHGGSYIDPVTKNARQFDIRAQKDDRQQLLRVRCAIECKNLTESFPLIVMCVPRSREESFHKLMFSFESTSAPGKTMTDVLAFRKVCQAIRIENDLSGYRARSPVGKSLAQVGRLLALLRCLFRCPPLLECRDYRSSTNSAELAFSFVRRLLWCGSIFQSCPSLPLRFSNCFTPSSAHFSSLTRCRCR
jgi:hypothetical protein